MEKLAIQMLDSVAGIRRLASANTEELSNLREVCAGLAALLKNHTEALKMHQAAIESLLKTSGAANVEPPENPPAGPVN